MQRLPRARLRQRVAKRPRRHGKTVGDANAFWRKRGVKFAEGRILTANRTDIGKPDVGKPANAILRHVGPSNMRGITAGTASMGIDIHQWLTTQLPLD